jgi:pyruvate dehydrogenase E1 component
MSAVPDEVMKYVANAKDDEDPQETGEWLEALDGGFNHFWRAPTLYDVEPFLACIRRPGVSSGPFVAGHLRARVPRRPPDEEQLRSSARKWAARASSSYPHPWLMPDFWQFPTVSMGLGPIMAIYQARFMKYLHAPRHRRHRSPQGLGLPGRRRDGRAGIARRDRRWPAARRLDNLIFVINCNLQRLDGPVRGNGKIIQELESEFRGAGWNVIKVLWGSAGIRCSPATRTGAAAPDDGRPSTANTRPTSRVGALSCASTSSASRNCGDGRRMSRRRHLAPEPRRPRSAQGLRGLRTRGQAQGQPTVILAKTVKGYGMGEAARR